MTGIAAFPTNVTYDIGVESEMQGTIQLFSMPNSDTTPPEIILSLNHPQKWYCDVRDVDMSDPSSVERFIVFEE